MSYGVCLGGLWRPKREGAKSVASGPFALPGNLILDSGRGHRFVIKQRKKTKAAEPDFDLWLFEADGADETLSPVGLGNGDQGETPSAFGTNDADDVPF